MAKMLMLSLAVVLLAGCGGGDKRMNSASYQVAVENTIAEYAAANVTLEAVINEAIDARTNGTYGADVWRARLGALVDRWDSLAERVHDFNEPTDRKGVQDALKPMADCYDDLGEGLKDASEDDAPAFIAKWEAQGSSCNTLWREANTAVESAWP